MNRDRSGPVALDYDEAARGSATQGMCPFQDRIEDRHPVTERGIDDLRYLGSRCLQLRRFGKFSLLLGKLTLHIGYELLGVG